MDTSINDSVSKNADVKNVDVKKTAASPLLGRREGSGGDIICLFDPVTSTDA